MGIKSINAFLKKNVPDAFYCTELSYFSGRRIAIDMGLLIYTYLCIANKNTIYEMSDPLLEIDRNKVMTKIKELLIQFVMRLANHNINPIFVWDGKCLESKNKCVNDRVSKKRTIIEEIESEKERLESIHVLLRKKEDLEKFRKKLALYNYITSEEKKYFKTMLKSMGFVNLQAETEAEKLCSILSKYKKVVAVWGNDTDNYALGTRILIKGFENNYLVNVVETKIILKELKLTKSGLTDLCIMSGCDFNQNIPNIGPAKAYKLLKTHGSLENIINNGIFKDEEIELLNYDECKNIHFNCEMELIEEEYEYVLVSNIEEILENYQLSEISENLINSLKKIKC